MWSLALANVRRNLGRLAATLLAIAVGVSFLTAASMFVRSIQNSLGGAIDAAYVAVDVAVSFEGGPEDDGGGGPGVLAASDIPDALRISIEELPEVAEVAGERVGTTSILVEEDAETDEEAEPFDAAKSLRNWIDGTLATQQLVEGRAPTADGEIAVDRGTAEDDGIAVGDRVEISTTAGAVPVEVVGITSLTDADAIDPSGTITVAESWIHDVTGDGTPEWTDLLVSMEADLPAADASQVVSDATPDTFVVLTGDEFREQASGSAGEFGETLRPILQGFALLALFVCSIVIYNTYAVVVAQRRRELALVRAVAATPRQVWLSLCGEGFLVGLLGSALGVAGGAALTFGMLALLESFDVGVSGIAPSVTVRDVLTGLAVGTLVSLIAVQLPALRGARTAPVEAMREAHVEAGALSRPRWIAAAVLIGLGVTGLVIVPNGLIVALSAVAFVVGIFVAGPALAVLIARLARPLLRPFGMAGVLSAQNLERNPRRTSSTANALVIGVLLVTLVTVGGTILQRWTVDVIADQSTADAVVATLPGGELPPEVVEEIRAIDTVKRVVVLQSAQVDGEGDFDRLSAAAPDELAAIGITAATGSLDDLGGGVAVLGFDGETDEVGSVVLENGDGTIIRLPITATIDFSLDSIQLGYLVSPETLAQLPLEAVDSTAYVLAEPGSAEETADDVAAAVRGYSTLYSYAGNLFADLINDAFSFLINAINALLGMSVIIALIGIVNTLSLSIFERRQETGLLRAVGMAPREVRRMIRLESIQIAVLGTLVGFVGGMALALLLIRAADIDAAISFNVGRLALILGLGVVVGVVASILPTRRVSRAGIVEALHSE